ncbi:aldehyde dehydrogenase family protein [Streptomyces sp. NPDC094468]|uniref:aldehyde dehydrogenase family protein n=1 Tax=Streptomyces sp. NPDC094468 TaxID=3366066 RepID=UPI00382BE740
MALADDRPYGPAGTVGAANTEGGDRIARRMRTGTAGVVGYQPDVTFPFGGWKASGLGTELGPVGPSPRRTSLQSDQSVRSGCPDRSAAVRDSRPTTEGACPSTSRGSTVTASRVSRRYGKPSRRTSGTGESWAPPWR